MKIDNAALPADGGARPSATAAKPNGDAAAKFEAQVAKHIDAISKLRRNRARDRFAIGVHLNQLKELRPDGQKEVPHGDFLRFVDRCHLGHRSAQRYMLAAKAFEGKYDAVSHLPIHQSAIEALAARGVPGPARDEAIKRAQAGETVTKDVAKQIVAGHGKKRREDRTPSTVAQLQEAVQDVGKELRQWCKKKSSLFLRTPDQQAHDARVKLADLMIAKVYNDAEDFALLVERVEAARLSRQQSEAA